MLLVSMLLCVWSHVFPKPSPSLKGGVADAGYVCLCRLTAAYLVPHISERGVFHGADKSGKFGVHIFEFRTDAEKHLDTFLLRHLGVREAYRAYVVDYLHALRNHFAIGLVAVG